MDLGLQGRKAIVSAASKGLGKACAMSLAREGSQRTLLLRLSTYSSKEIQGTWRTAVDPANAST